MDGGQFSQDYFASQLPRWRPALERLDGLIRQWQPDLEVKLWHSMGFPILGYGRAAYRYSDGRAGEWFIVGLAGHKAYMSLYVWGFSDGVYLLEKYGYRLGKVKTGKSCLNFKSVGDLNLRALQEVIGEAVASQQD